MAFEQVLDTLLVVASIAIPLLFAKFINKRTPAWHLWTGRVGKLAGLVVALCDLLRKPSDVAEDLRAPGATVDLKKTTALLVLPFVLSGCAAWQVKGLSWQEATELTSYRVFKQVEYLEKHALPLIADACVGLVADCKAAGDAECKPALACADAYYKVTKSMRAVLDACRGANYAVAIADKETAELKALEAIKALTELMADLGKMGVL
jgi:hypothetical protein